MSWDRSRAFAMGVAGVLLIGVVLRLLEYSTGRPLWLDEAMLALGIGGRGAVELLAPLPYDQNAAPLFLLAVKVVTAIGGMGEYALRLVPLVAGLLLPWLVWRMARALAGPGVGLVAAALSVVSVTLIYYSAELKPYGVDSAVSAALMLLTASTRADPERRSRWWRLAIAGLVGGLLSSPAPLIQAGALAGLVADARVRVTPGAGKRIAMLAIAWMSGASLTYILVSRHVAASPYMLTFWGGTFFDFGAADFPQRAYGFIHSVLSPLPSSMEWLQVRWLALVGAAGFALLVRRSGIASVLQVIVPVVALTLASSAGKYPIGNRLLLFLAPCTFLLVAVLIVEGLRAVRLSAPWATAVGVVLVGAWGGRGVIRNALAPQVFSEGRETAWRIQEAPPDEPVYIMSIGLPAWAYYSTDWRRPDTTRLRLFERVAAATGPAAGNDLIPQAAGSLPAGALEYRGSGRLELIGARTGISYREPDGLDGIPHVSWAGREADRVAGTGRPYVWIYGTHWVTELLPALRAELTLRGMVVVEMMSEHNAVALRVRLPNHPADSRSRAPAPARP